MKRILLALLLTACTESACAQLLSDTLFTWRGYVRESTCRVRTYLSASGQSRPFTIVIQEISANAGRSTFDDVQHLVALLARQAGLDPESAFWIFHWGAFSFAGAESSNREVFFRATFRRTAGGGVSQPTWRLETREAVEAYTDRAFR